MLKRVLSIILALTLVMGNSVGVLAAEGAADEKVVKESGTDMKSEESTLSTTNSYELEIKNGVVV